LGLQEEKLVEAKIWVLPNPSGLNAHHRLADLVRLFAELRLQATLQPNPNHEMEEGCG
jgi:TDG/mug DNA glycosylase family protein